MLNFFVTYLDTLINFPKIYKYLVKHMCKTVTVTMKLLVNVVPMCRL